MLDWTQKEAIAAIEEHGLKVQVKPGIGGCGHFFIYNPLGSLVYECYGLGALSGYAAGLTMGIQIGKQESK